MLGVLDDLQAIAWAARRKTMEAWFLPAAVLDADAGTILCRDGSLVTLVSIGGSLSLMGPAELAAFVETATRRWNGLLTSRGHAFHVVFERDSVSADVDAAGERQAAAARRLGLDVADLMAERRARLSELVAGETLLLACWTRPSALTPDQVRRDRTRARKRLRDWLPRPGEAQCPLAAYDTLLPRHDAMLSAVEGTLAETAIDHHRLAAAPALAAMRRMIGGSRASAADWQPVTLANDAPPRETEPPETGAFPPPLAPQVLVADPHRAGRAIELGERRYAGLDMVLGPRASRPFSELMAGIANARLPVRLSILVEGGGMASAAVAIAKISAAFLAFSSDDSMACRNAMRDLAEIRADATAIVRLRLSLLTWTGLDAGHDELLRRQGRLQQLLEGWGEIVATPLTGDLLETIVGTIPGFACGSTAEPALAPISEALTLWPVSRPAPLARDRFNHVFRSPDGRALPFSFESAEDYGFDLIYGVPGRGKSVLMNSLALAWCLQAGREDLPLTAIIDIGPSSSGLISLIRDALPAARRHEARFFRLTMDPGSAINPFDTQLGCREPLAAEKAFLFNLLALILTPAGHAGVPDGIRDLVGPTIDAAYRLRDDRIAGSEPHVYTPGRDEAVDAALERTAVHPGETPRWWHIVDLLFDAGETVAALRAQRFAVPVMSDLLAAVRDPSVQGTVASAVYGAGGESVTAAFTRILTGLSSAWPIFFRPTAFELGAARLAAIDLREVAPSGSPEADRQSAAVFMLARHALTRHWWIADDALAGVDERYRDWHARRLAEIREAPKRLCYDEFHRAASAPAVTAQVERDVRETRKLRVTMTLASQRLDDFGPALVELANRTWVLGAAGKQTEIARLSEIFGLSETLADAVRFSLTGPTGDGAPALLIAASTRGRIEQLAVNAPGPVELWALTTSPRDVALRERLYQLLTPAGARAALARHFPTGSAAQRIAAGLAEREARGATASEADVLDQIASEIAASPPGAARAA